MDLRITSLIAEYGYKDRRYRDIKKRSDSIEKILEESSASDFILLPAGFIITDQEISDALERTGIIKEISDICRDYKGVLILGIDSPIQSSVAVIIDGRWAYFNQSCTQSIDTPNENIRDNRHFEYKGVRFSAVCCGELFNEEFRRVVFDKDNLPKIIFGAVHSGRSFQHGTYKLRLNEYSKCVSFYAYHSNSEPSGMLSGADEKGRIYISGLGWMIRYEIDISRRYIFPVNRKISED